MPQREWLVFFSFWIFFYIDIEHVEFSRVIPDENINTSGSTPKHKRNKNKITDKFPFNVAYSIPGNIEPSKLHSKSLYN